MMKVADLPIKHAKTLNVLPSVAVVFKNTGLLAKGNILKNITIRPSVNSHQVYNTLVKLLISLPTLK